MFVTQTNIQNEGDALLHPSINNVNGKLYVALREFHCDVGYIQIDNGVIIMWYNSIEDRNPLNLTFNAGRYNFKDIQQLFNKNLPQVTIDISDKRVISINTGNGFLWINNV